MRRSTLLTTSTKAGMRTDDDLDIDAIEREMGTTDSKPTTLREASHCQIVKLEDGTSGWVIDMDAVAKEKMLRSGMDSIMKLASDDDPLFDAFAIDTSRKVDAMTALLNSGSRNYTAGELAELQRQFSRYTYGPGGLLPADDPKAAIYRHKMELLHSGKVRLPTVKEYEEQLKELNESRKEGNDMNNTNQNQPPQAVNRPVVTPPQTPPVQAAPVQPVQRERTIDPNANVVGVQPIAVSQPNPKPEQPQPAVSNIPTVQQVSEMDQAVEQKPKAPVTPIQPINIAKAQAVAAVEKPAPEPEPEAPTAEPGIVIQIPAEETATFMNTLPQELKEKVNSTATLEVQSVVLENVPVATRTIDTITDFKNLLPKKVVGDLVEKVLINSGYIATVDGASSLDMATIAYDPSTEVADWPKMIQFAYDHLVNTSIGHLTFPKFVKETSAQDIPVLIAAIYQASEPDVKKMMVQCGNPRCKDTHEIAFSVSNMWDTSEFDDETIAYFNEIIAARDNIFQAREVHNRAPVMRVDYLQFDDMYFGVKHTDAETAATYFPAAQQLALTYNQAVTIYVAFIKEVRIVNESTTYSSSSPEVICQALFNISNDNGQVAIRNFITNNVKEYKNYRFRMKPLDGKGAYVCEKCGHVDESISINPETLVFRKASATGIF